MAKQKYDWKALKLEFFASEYDEVKDFIRNKLGIYNRNAVQSTKGRAKDKQAYKQSIIDKALEERAKKDAKDLEIPLEELKKAKKAVLWLLIRKITAVIKNEDEITVSEQERLLKMIKTELWEPTTISKNDTVLKWEPLDENLFIQN